MFLGELENVLLSHQQAYSARCLSQDFKFCLCWGEGEGEGIGIGGSKLCVAPLETGIGDSIKNKAAVYDLPLTA